MWIKTSQRLPDSDDPVIGYGDSGYELIYYLTTECRWIDKSGMYYYDFNRFTHWQPLPDPPKD